LQTESTIAIVDSVFVWPQATARGQPPRPQVLRQQLPGVGIALARPERPLARFHSGPRFPGPSDECQAVAGTALSELGRQWPFVAQPFP